MLSAVKNFFLAFLLSALIFGLIATFAVRLVVDNINSTLAADEGESGTSPDQQGGDAQPGQKDSTVRNADTVNILLIGSSYRSGIYADYDPQAIKAAYGIEPKEFTPLPAPGDVAPIYIGQLSDDMYAHSSDGIDIGDGQLVFRHGLYNVSYRPLTADVILLLRIDPGRHQMTLTQFSPDVSLSVNGVYTKMGEIYGKNGIATLCDAVHLLTGLPVNGYIAADGDSFPGIIDQFGGLEYTVPENVELVNPSNGEVTKLFRGSVKMSGETAYELTAFNGYKEAGNTRDKTAVGMIRTLILKLASPENRESIPSIAGVLLGYARTDIEGQKLAGYLSLLTSCSVSVIEIQPVTEKALISENEKRDVFNLEKTRAAFAVYKKTYE